MRTPNKPSSQYPSHPSRILRAGVAALVAGATVTAYAPRAHADDVSPTGKGIVGGALLGAEAVTIVESIAGVRKTWAYLLGGGLGAVGGGIGGYFVEQGSSDGRVPMYMLAGGLALIIPAVVLTLNATRYMPDEAATEDKAPTNGPEANPGASGGGSVVISPGGASVGGSVGGSTTGPQAPATTPPPSAPNPNPGTPGSQGNTGGGTAEPHPAPALSLLQAGQGGVSLGVPIPTVKPMWTMAEQQKMGLQQGTEVRLPVLHVTF